MRRVALLALAMTALLSGTAFASAHHTKVVSDCQHARYKPRSITLACDQTFILTKITYTKWGARVAKGADRTVINECNPNCAAGKTTYHHHDRFTLDRPKAKNGVTVFTRARIYRHGKLVQTWPLSFPN